MILYESFAGEGVEEYAIHRGAWDRAMGKPKSADLFSSNVPLAAHLRNLYELAYEMEDASGVLYETAIHSTTAFVRDWNDLQGYGCLETVLNGLLLKLPFTYHELDEDKELQLAQVVSVRFMLGADEPKVLSIKTISPPLYEHRT